MKRKQQQRKKKNIKKKRKNNNRIKKVEIMLYGLVELSTFDAVTISAAFITLALVQWINRILVSTSEVAASETTPISTVVTASASGTDTLGRRISATKGNIQKQSSEHSEDSPSTTASSSPIPDQSARNSIKNGSIPIQSSLDNFGDDCHEDGDTISLDNLFPCDQTEIRASKKISFIIDELIQTEANYVNNLKRGVQNYGHLDDHQDLPEGLRGKEHRQLLLGNIEEILELHKKQILPIMLRNQNDLKSLFDEISTLCDKNVFYCYSTFTMNKKASMQLRLEHREWFQRYQSLIHDKLGIDSFLVQPIQRLTRYPLLLQQFISEFYKSGIVCKRVLTSVCKLETRMRRLLMVVNQAEEITSIDDISDLNLKELGYFRRSTEFDAYHHRTRKKYRAKVFLFDRCLICTEIRKKRLIYRQHYFLDSFDLQLNTSKSITIILRTPHGNKDEYDFSAPEGISVTQWMRFARKIIDTARYEIDQSGKFSLPMDLVLGVGTAVWLIWHYLY